MPPHIGRCCPDLSVSSWRLTVATKVAAAPRTPSAALHDAAVCDLLASSEIIEELRRRRGRSSVALLDAATDAHRQLLARYAALGPSLRN
jgi:hypothetical protein